MAGNGKTYVYTKERGLRILKDPARFNEYRLKYPSAMIVHPPSMEELEEMVSDGICEAIDGCTVEPDGTCEHGFPSWLLALNII